MKNSGFRLSLLFVAALAVLFVMPLSAMGNKEEASTDPNAMEKNLVLYSSMTENDLSNLIRLFSKRYPEVKIEVVNGSAGELTTRIRAERNNPQGDLMWGGLSTSDGMVHSDIFAHWLTQYEPEIMPDYRSPNGFYSIDHLSTAVFCVNVELEKELGLKIKGYKDLLDPRLKGKIVMPDPNSASSGWNNVSNMMAVYGHGSPAAWDYIEKFLNNGVVFYAASSTAFKSVETGEYVVGLTYEDGASTLLKAGSKKIRMVYPEDGASASAFGCALIQGAPHPNAAKAMINYLMSAEGQSELGTALETLRFTNSKAVYETLYLPASSTIKWVRRDNNWLVENKKAVLEKWNGILAKVKK
ncbi:ABC transporter substrate-binding protein [Spirochaetota bacterium]